MGRAVATQNRSLWYQIHDEIGLLSRSEIDNQIEIQQNYNEKPIPPLIASWYKKYKEYHGLNKVLVLSGVLRKSVSHRVGIG